MKNKEVNEILSILGKSLNESLTMQQAELLLRMYEKSKDIRGCDIHGEG